MDDKTTEMPRVPPQPTKLHRTPTSPQQRTMLYLCGAIGTMAGAIILGLGFLAFNSDNTQSKENTKQVEACVKIQDPTLAFVCVDKVDD